MKNVLIYNAEGQVLRTVYCPQHLIDAQLEEGERALIVTAPLDNSKIYIKSGAVLPRPGFSKLQHVEGLTVTFKLLPIGTEVSVNGHTLIVDEEHTVIEFEVPGTYFVQLSKFPYITEVRKITVGE